MPTSEQLTTTDASHSFTVMPLRLLQATLRDEQTVRDCCLHCGTEHYASCVVNEAHLALVGRPIERP